MAHDSPKDSAAHRGRDPLGAPADAPNQPESVRHSPPGRREPFPKKPELVPTPPPKRNFVQRWLDSIFAEK